MQLFDSKYHAKLLETKIQDHVEYLSLNNIELPTLAIIQIGDNKTSEVYINLKLKLCKKFGIPVKFHKLNLDRGESYILENVKNIVTRSHIESVIIQLPLPIEIRAKILDLIPPEKDIDLLSSTKQQVFYSSAFSFCSPTVRACEYFIDSIKSHSTIRKALIIGGGFLVGKPIAYYLNSKGFVSEIIEDYRVGRGLNADLVILSAGIPKLVKGEDLSAKRNVIDFGSSFVNGKTIGDLDMLSKIDHLGTISPSPGGMGPLVVRFLVMNHLGI